MTNPDPVAELAGRYEMLLGQLARAQGDIGVLRERLERESGQVTVLRAEVKRLRGQLGEALDRRQLEPPPAPWWCGGEAERLALLAELREWVEKFLRPHYPGYLTRLPRCWFRHQEALWELSVIRAEWIRINGDEDNRELAGALTWHDRWLPDALSRLAGAIDCDMAGCRLDGPRY